MPPRRLPRHLCTLLALLALLGTSCLTAEQKMIVKVDRFMEQQRWDDALGYLDRYLSKHRKSLAGWRYRVLIRLEQGERALAAGEYSALNESLERHEPEVLESVVLGAGGRWLLSDYRALARCAPAGIVDPAFFTEVLEPKGLSEGSFSKVAIASDEIAAVLAALPGSLDPRETWPIVAERSGHPDLSIRERAVRAAGRHLATKQLGDEATGAALSLLRTGAGAREGELREAALLASLALPEGPGRADFVAGLVSDLALAGDARRAVSLFLLGPGGSGPGEWSEAQLQDWKGKAGGALATLSEAGLLSRGVLRTNKNLKRTASSGSADLRLASVVGFGNDVGVTLSKLWSGLSLEDKRSWGPAFVRSGAADRGQLAALALGEQDAVLTQAIAAALVLPDRGNDSAYEPALRAGLGALDPATRASAARAAVVRDASELSGEIGVLFERGHDRVMTESLQALVHGGGKGWNGLIVGGLAADTAHVRELAVDAAAASCRPEDRALMLGLLTDDDPHVSVRAASALYLLVGRGEK